MEEPTTKVCSVCKAEKAPSEFYKMGAGLRARCKQCDKADSARWREENLEYDRARYKVWADANRDKISASGKARRAANPEKCAALAKASREKHKEKATRRHKEYLKENAARVAAAGRAYQEANREKIAANNRAYREANRDKRTANQMRREATKLQATPSWADPITIGEFYWLAAWKTKMTGKQYHVDHIVPLRSDLVCGLHTPYNLQVLPGTENIRKGNRFWPDMPEEELQPLAMAA